MPDSTKVTRVWVYKLKNGKYYKQHGKGSWALSLNGVRTKDITTNLANAAQFAAPMDTEPYFHPSMRGGQWLQVECKTTMEILVSDQEGTPNENTSK
ncbi:hypothetical protein VPHK45_0035 [Vibrio phage K45]